MYRFEAVVMNSHCLPPVDPLDNVVNGGTGEVRRRVHPMGRRGIYNSLGGTVGGVRGLGRQPCKGDGVHDVGGGGVA